MNDFRRAASNEVRERAAHLAESREHPRHFANGDEQKFRGKNPRQPSYLASFTKGLPHDFATGLASNPEDFQWFVRGIDSGNPRDFIDTPLGPPNYQPGPGNNLVWEGEKAKKAADKNGIGLRAWESQAAGLAFDLEGPDAQAVTMPPAPVLGSHELIGEMGEVYVQALLRDVPFTQIVDSGVLSHSVTCENGTTKIVPVANLIGKLGKLPWFNPDLNDCIKIAHPSKPDHTLSPEERERLRVGITRANAFRGITPGDTDGPYISQFLLSGNQGINSNDAERSRADGLITYGAISIDQRVRYASPCVDYMTQWADWYDVQQAANLTGLESYVKKERRFITTPRDLATYVHYDALYEAYLNACLIMLSEGYAFDPGLPFRREDYVDHQQAFAHFGGPHILSLVTEVATRALKAVRFQKFNVHRRLRPEALAARISKQISGDLDEAELKWMADDLKDILTDVDGVNPNDPNLPGGNHLLPMAFCEGSPMHPAYGAGHATVAGACVTILKAFFDHGQPVTLAGGATDAFVPLLDGSALQVINTGTVLTVEGELNKLASNISIGRDWAGVHYFTDYIESLRLGEQIAIGILEEQKLTYGENFSMTVPLFDGGSIRI